PEGVMIAQTDLHMAGYTDDSALPIQRRILDAASHIPGVTDVGIVNSLPLSGGGSNWSVFREGTADLRPSNSVMSPRAYQVSPGYLHADSTSIITGRDFTWDDGPKKPSVAIVNRTFAHKMFGDQPVVGLHFLG